MVPSTAPSTTWLLVRMWPEESMTTRTSRRTALHPQADRDHARVTVAAVAVQSGALGLTWRICWRPRRAGGAGGGRRCGREVVLPSAARTVAYVPPLAKAADRSDAVNTARPDARAPTIPGEGGSSSGAAGPEPAQDGEWAPSRPGSAGRTGRRTTAEPWVRRWGGRSRLAQATWSEGGRSRRRARLRHRGAPVVPGGDDQLGRSTSDDAGLRLGVA